MSWKRRSPTTGQCWHVTRDALRDREMREDESCAEWAQKVEMVR